MAEISGADEGGMKEKMDSVEGKLANVEARSLKVVADLDKVEGFLAAMVKKSVIWNLNARMKKRRLQQERDSLIKERGSLVELETILWREKDSLVQERLALLKSKNAPLEREEQGVAIASTLEGDEITKIIQRELALEGGKLRTNMQTWFAEVNDKLDKGKVFSQMVMKSQFEPTLTPSNMSKNVKGNICSAYGLDLESDMVRCFVTGVELPWNKIKTAHIYQRRWPRAFLQTLGIDVHAPHNLLLLWNLVESAFDKFHIAIIPRDGVFTCHLLYPKIRHWMIDSNADRLSSVTWNNVDGKQLQFPNDFRPAKRLCAFHASLAVSHAIQNKWVSEEQAPTVPADAFGSPNYDSELMTEFLEDQRKLQSSLPPRTLDFPSTSSTSST